METLPRSEINTAKDGAPLTHLNRQKQAGKREKCEKKREEGCSSPTEN